MIFKMVDEGLWGTALFFATWKVPTLGSYPIEYHSQLELRHLVPIADNKSCVVEKRSF